MNNLLLIFNQSVGRFKICRHRPLRLYCSKKEQEMLNNNNNKLYFVNEYIEFLMNKIYYAIIL